MDVNNEEKFSSENDVPYDEFKKEWYGILEYIKKQSEAK